jgi:ribosomal protein S19
VLQGGDGNIWGRRAAHRDYVSIHASLDWVNLPSSYGHPQKKEGDNQPQISKMFPTRVLLTRSVWKGKINAHSPLPYTNTPQDPILSRKLEILDLSAPSLTRHRLPIVRVIPGQKVVPIRTQARAATILPNFVGLKFQVHNGKIYQDITITEDMVGHKLGEFSPYDHLP